MSRFAEIEIEQEIYKTDQQIIDLFQPQLSPNFFRYWTLDIVKISRLATYNPLDLIDNLHRLDNSNEVLFTIEELIINVDYMTDSVREEFIKKLVCFFKPEKQFSTSIDIKEVCLRYLSQYIESDVIIEQLFINVSRTDNSCRELATHFLDARSSVFYLLNRRLDYEKI